MAPLDHADRNRRIRERREAYEAELIDQGIMLEDARRAARLRFADDEPSEWAKRYDDYMQASEVKPRCSQETFKVNVFFLIELLLGVGLFVAGWLCGVHA